MQSVTLTAELFESIVDKSLAVVKGDATEHWRVVRVERRAEHALRADQPFNVYLTAPVTPENRAQGIRRARFDSGEEFEFFAVPIAATSSEISFEVIFN
jgi:hypothetical protein